MQLTPTSTVGPWVSPTAFATSTVVSTNASVRGIEMPSTCFTWDATMMIAEAAVNPTSTECDRKLTTNPSRPKRSARWTAPTSTASSAAPARYDDDPSSYSGASAVAVISDTMATGPTANWREVPNAAYASTGAIEAYRPIWGGRPASSA